MWEGFEIRELNWSVPLIDMTFGFWKVAAVNVWDSNVRDRMRL